MQRVLLRTLPALAVAVCLAVVALVITDSAATRAATATELLPDLEQQVPTGLEITRHVRAPHWRLGFRSAISNVGDGPLIISGRRPLPGVEKMVADQVIEQEGAPAEVVSGAGRLRYVRARDHRHWHLLGFDRYELRRPGCLPIFEQRIPAEQTPIPSIQEIFDDPRACTLRRSCPIFIYIGYCGQQRTASWGPQRRRIRIIADQAEGDEHHQADTTPRPGW